MRRPNLFIVGAPKCGTTSLHAYLADHPDVFFPARKELNHFGADLRYRKPLTRARYERFFDPWSDERYGGEASVFYLFSTSAAAELADYAPDARIIAMVRQPVEAMHSLHQQLVFSGDEDEPRFDRALGLEPERRAGRRIPARADHPHGLRYRDVVDFAPQIRRYHEAFGRDAVHVVLYDDLAHDTPGTYRRILDWLDLEDDGRTDFAVHNPASRVRSATARHLVEDPPAGLRRVARATLRNQRVRQAVRRGARRTGRRLNQAPAGREPLDPALRAQLTEELAPRILELADLLGRDLDRWLEPAPADSAPS